MQGQLQAFRAYYASMTDAELLSLAANRSSFIDVAQQTLTEELTRRKLPEPVAASEPEERHCAVHDFLHGLRHHKAHG